MSRIRCQYKGINHKTGRVTYECGNPADYVVEDKHSRTFLCAKHYRRRYGQFGRSYLLKEV